MCSARSLGSASNSFSRARSSSACRAAARAREGAGGDLAVHHAAEDLRARADQRAAGAFQIKHERRRVDDPQRPVDVDRIRLALHAKPLGGDELEDIAGLDVLLSLEHRRFELFAREITGEFQRQLLRRVDLPQLAHRGLAEPPHQFINAPAGVFVGDLDIGMPVQIGVGDDLDRLVDVIENDNLGVKPEQQIGQMPVVFGRVGEFFAFVISNRVIPGISHEPAGEIRKLGVVVIAASGDEAFQLMQRVRGSRILWARPRLFR